MPPGPPPPQEDGDDPQEVFLWSLSATGEEGDNKIYFNFGEALSGELTGSFSLKEYFIGNVPITYPDNITNQSEVEITLSKSIHSINRYIINFTPNDDLTIDSSGDNILDLLNMSVNISRLSRSLVTTSAPQHQEPPYFTINGVSYETRNIDLNIEEMIECPNINGTAYISFENISEEFEIRYSTNSKIPNNKSRLYNGPIVIHNNVPGSDLTVIRARIYHKTNSNIKTRIIKIKFRII